MLCNPANRAQALGAGYQGGTMGMFDGKVVIVTGRYVS